MAVAVWVGAADDVWLPVDIQHFDLAAVLGGALCRELGRPILGEVADADGDSVGFLRVDTIGVAEHDDFLFTGGLFFRCSKSITLS